MGITQGSVQTNGLSHLLWQKWEVSHLLLTAGHHTFHIPDSWTNLLPIQDQSQLQGDAENQKANVEKAHTLNAWEPQKIPEETWAQVNSLLQEMLF